MKKFVYDSYEQMSYAAADVFARQVAQKPDSVFGLATGSTPIGLYDELAKRYSEGELDFSKAKSFNLDEYYPIKRTHEQSYYYFMNHYLFDKVNFAETHIPDGETDNPEQECVDYDAKIKDAGGVDLQLLGIGFNWHVGFNEPSSTYMMRTNLTDLTNSTLEANSRFFSEGEIQPTTALTIGFGAIFSAKKILLLISGAGKAEIAKKLFDDKIYTDIPASLLLLHPDVTVMMDKAAAEG